MVIGGKKEKKKCSENMIVGGKKTCLKDMAVVRKQVAVVKEKYSEGPTIV